MIVSSPASAPTTSAGVVRCTGPGRSAVAVRKARRNVAPAAPARSSAVHFEIGPNIWAWFSTWWVNTASRRVSIWPEMATSGTRSSRAVATALVMLEEPGPRVESATPGRPVTWA